jgi:hypothetical protein
MPDKKRQKKWKLLYNSVHPSYKPRSHMKHESSRLEEFQIKHGSLDNGFR